MAEHVHKKARISDDCIEIGQNPIFSQLGEYTRIAKYALFLPHKGRRETWEEQCQRVINMHKKKYSNCPAPIYPELKYAYNAILNRQVLGSQRALQFGGPPVLQKNTRIYNCAASYADRVRFFSEIMFVLLCGSGSGFSVQRCHTSKLPPVWKPFGDKIEFQVEDSIEGWSDAIGALVSSYFTHDQTFPHFAGKIVTFNMKNIRVKGSSISNINGKAPGPEPLANSLEKIRRVLNSAVERPEVKTVAASLHPIDVYDIVMHISDAVLAGGVRRSACICMFDADDKEMLGAKTGDWFIKNPQRGRSNNSAVLIRGEVTLEQFQSIFEYTKQFGEPGFIWSDHRDALFNPCVEASLYGYDEHGNSGFEFCNLTEINMGMVKTPAEFYAACRAAAIIGTLQAGYTDFGYLGEVTKRIVERERLLGVSMTGMMDCPHIAFNPEVLREGVAIIRVTNETLARKIGINPSARLTCIKPAGTTSCLLNTASGIHPRHSKRYFRRVQANHSEGTLGYFKTINPDAVERSVWSASNTDDVITFMCEADEKAVVKSDMNAIQLLEKVRLVQEHWVRPGTIAERCFKPFLVHNVSNTINVCPDEWDEVCKYIYCNRADFAGISLLPASGDKDYEQAPFQEVLTSAEVIAKYGTGALFASGLIVHAHNTFGGNLYKACACLLGQGEKLGSADLSDADAGSVLEKKSIFNKKAWLAQAKKFAKNHFNCDLTKMVHCLKDVDALHKWTTLKKVYKPIDWSKFKEGEPTAAAGDIESGCAGGSCEMVRF